MDKRAHNSLEYYLPGASPRFLLFSVLPGNEFESGPLLEHNLIEHPENLPDFLYIPPVIPSAVAAKTRKICTVTTSTGSFADDADPRPDPLWPLFHRINLPFVWISMKILTTLGFYLYDTDQMSEGRLNATARASQRPVPVYIPVSMMLMMNTSCCR